MGSVLMPSQAQRASAAVTPTFSVTPSQGPPGTLVDLQSITPCVAPSGATNWHVLIYVSYYTPDDIGAIFPATTTPSPSGDWGLTFTPSSVPGVGLATITATCLDDQGDSESYATETFLPTTSGHGYWLATRGTDVNVLDFGDAYPIVTLPIGEAFVGMATDPQTGSGVWLVAADGGVFSYGNATFEGSAYSLKLARPIVGMAATPDGKGYWLVAADGGVFSYGDAAFAGSAGALKLARPIVGMAATPDGKGYWLVAADGGVFSYGGAQFYGSAAGFSYATPTAFFAIVATPSTVAGE
jgi:hypothetical protein